MANSPMVDELLRDVIFGCIQEALYISRVREANEIQVYPDRMALNATKRIVAAIQLREMILELRREKENLMPNSVSYSDEGTVVRAMTAIAGDGDLNMAQLMGVLNRLNEAGILFREAAEEKPRGPRKKNADGTDAAPVEGEDFGNEQGMVQPPVPEAPVSTPAG